MDHPIPQQHSVSPLSHHTPRPGEVHSDALLDERGQLIIHHAQRRYVLRLTKSGKLILTA